MVLPPCHNFFQFYTRELSLDERISLIENGHDCFDLDLQMGNVDDVDNLFNDLGTPSEEISLMWNQRSVDILRFTIQREILWFTT